MSKFNTKKPSTKTINKAGGQAYKESSKLELTSLVLTSFLKDKFYENGADQHTRLKKLLNEVEPEFAAKLALVARNEWGMRSVSHVIASSINASCKTWAKKFFYNIIRRPDDILEILACRYNDCEEITHAMRKGFAKKLSEMSSYALAKYRGEGKQIKMVDAINLIRPKPTDSINALMQNKLKSFDTWEVELSKAGSDKTKKAQVWRNLISEKKIGQFALLRNLRNILEQADEDVQKMACDLLVEEDRIKNSLILPFRYSTAYDQISKLENSGRILTAISKACDISLNNVPKIEGDILVVLDTSGSMGEVNTPESCFSKASVFASVLIKALNADLLTFADNATKISLDSNNSVLGIRKEINAKRINGGTNFNCIFPSLTKHYDKVIILSDMQGWMEYHTPTKSLEDYEKKFGKTMVYSFDLNGYGTMQFPEKSVIALAGWSEKILDLMKIDTNSIVSVVEATNLENYKVDTEEVES